MVFRPGTWVSMEKIPVPQEWQDMDTSLDDSFKEENSDDLELNLS